MNTRQQQKKDMEKKVKINSAKSSNKAENKKSLFGVCDDLDLGNVPSLQVSDYLSEELVQHLNDQIRELKDENGRLYKCLSEKDYEIRFLNKKCEEGRLASQFNANVQSNDVTACKIVELSKKIRVLNVEVECEKTKVAQYARKITHLEKELKAQVSLSGVSDDKNDLKDAASPGSVTESEFKSVCEKLRVAENRAAEFKMQQQALKQEIQKLSKALAREVGDGYNIHSILANNASWRGRQQQISFLQKKLNEMRTELNHYKLNQSELSLDETSSLAGSATRRQEESQSRDRIRKLEKERKEALERSAAELQALETDHEDLKKRFEGSKARNKVLSNELKVIKQQLTVMSEKGKNDDDLIRALMQQLETFKKLADDASELNQKAVEASEKQMREMSQKTQHNNNVTEQLKSILAEKDAKVHQLEDEIANLRQENLHMNQNHTVNLIFANQQDDENDFSPDELDEPETVNQMNSNESNMAFSNADDPNWNQSNIVSNSGDSPMIGKGLNDRKKKSTDASANRRSSLQNRDGSAKCERKVQFTPREVTNLSENVPRINTDNLELTDIGQKNVHHSTNSRNNSARIETSQKPPCKRSARPPPSFTGCQNSNTYAQKHAQIRSNSATDNRSKSVECAELPETETLQRAAEVECDRLNQLVASLQTRIKEMTQNVLDVTNELQSQKRMNVSLEKQLGKCRVEQTPLKGAKTTSFNGGKVNRSLANLEADLTDASLRPTEANIRDLQLSLALQRDENQALKAALQSTLKAKENDLRLYQETIDETRKVFLHGIRNFKKTMTN